MAGDMSYEHHCRSGTSSPSGEEKVEPRWLPPVGLSAIVIIYIYIHIYIYTILYIHGYANPDENGLMTSRIMV